MKQYRITNKIKIYHICNNLNIDSRTYLNYENNMGIIPINFLIEFSDYYHISINKLLNYNYKEANIIINSIKNIRKNRYLSQQDIENITGIKRKAVSNIENHYQTIKVRELLLLVNLYDLDPETLIRCIYY